MKISASSFIQILCVLFLHLTSAEADERHRSQIRFTHHNEDLGLSSNNVFDILKDESGWVWMATDKGLNQFDAYENTIHRHKPDSNTSLSSDNLTCLALGHDGAIWVGTADAGLNRFDPASSIVQRILPGQYSPGKIDAKQLPSAKISALAVSEKKFLWIGTDRGLAVMNLLTKTIQKKGGVLGSERISCISVFEKDVWVGTAKGGVYRWSSEISEFKPVLDLNSPITAIARDTRLQIWVGTDGSGLFHLRHEELAEPVGLAIHDVHSIWWDNNGDLWIGTSQGLAKLNRGEETFRIFKSLKGEPASLGHNHVTKVFEDRSRTLWIATKGGGASRFHLDRYWFPLVKNNENVSKLPSDSIWSMAPSQDSERIWMGTERGVFQWICEQQRVDEEIPDFGEAGIPYAVSLLEDSRKNLWVGTKGKGLIKRSPEGIVTLFSRNREKSGDIGHNFVSELFEDSLGRIWVGTFGGGVYLHQAKEALFEKQETDDTTSFDFINRIREDSSGRIWAGCEEGLFVLKPGSKHWQNYSPVFRSKSQITDDEVTAILPVGDFLWLGTKRSGIVRVNLGTNQTTQYSTKTSDLPNDEVVSLSQDQKGFIWIATASGISRFDLVKSHIRNFTGDDGVQPGEFRRNAQANGIHSLSAKEIIFFGGEDGFNPIDPRQYPQIVQPPRPMLTSFEHYGRTVKPGEGEILKKPLSATAILKIPYDRRNQFAFRFANLDYRFPNQGHFRYILEGYDPAWITSDQDRRASYRSLPVGNYTFQVQSSPDGLDWPPTVAQVAVKITPPLYQTWWFMTLGAAFLIAGVVFIGRVTLRNRIKAIQRRESKISAQRDRAEAALARQLQQAVLLERTSRGFTQSGREDEIFTSPLKSLADHFGVDHGFIYRITTDLETEESNGIKLIANYSAKGKPKFPPLPLSYNDELVQHALQSESSFVVSTPHLIKKFLRHIENKPTVRSILFVGTRFLNRPNGLIALLSDEPDPEWNSEEFNLLNALSPQFGMSIAQMKIAEKEQHYLHHLEEARHQAEVANRAKSDFLAKMTHELRTPLNSIIGFTEILQDDPTLTPRQRELNSIVHNSGDHLLDVINDILDLSKIEAGKIEKSEETFTLLPLLKSVHEMLGMKAKAKKIAFDFTARTPIPAIVFTDRSKIRQTLINLLGNAIKFTDQGAVSMAVSATALGEPAEVDGMMRRKIRLTFEVADTGRGISEEELPGLFEKYSQTESGKRSTEGTGLGLPIARSFIQLLDGDIYAESEIGKGTRFVFYIECDEVAGAMDDSSSLSVSETQAQHINGFVASDREKVRILIAEDQPNNRLLLKKILGRAGFEMCEAFNGKEAVEKAASWQPDLILMDEDMPVMKGSEATRVIKGSTDKENAPVIISLTAYALEQARQGAFEAGCNDFLAKPFKAHEIFSMISRHLDLDYTYRDAA